MAPPPPHWKDQTTLLALAALSGWGAVAIMIASHYFSQRPSRGEGIGANVVEPLVDTIQGYIQRRSSPLVVGVAGGTGSGKTTFATTLYKNLGEEYVTYITHDSYYKDIGHLSIEERALTNFDHPDSLDTQLLVKHIATLKSGEAVHVPIYDYATHCRIKDTKLAEPRQVIIVEGILIFSDPELVKLFDIKVFVDTEADVRLIRRIDRDVTERGRSLRSIIDQYVTTVRPMHLEFVEPSKRVADLIVPTGINQVALDMFVSRLRHEINGENLRSSPPSPAR